jgi:hypothetical protein
MQMNMYEPLALTSALPNKSALPAAVVHLQPASNGWQSYEVHIMVTHLFLAGDYTSIEERRNWKSRKEDRKPGE